MTHTEGRKRRKAATNPGRAHVAPNIKRNAQERESLAQSIYGREKSIANNIHSQDKKGKKKIGAAANLIVRQRERRCT